MADPTQMSVFSLMKARLQMLGERQKLIAQNVAQARYLAARVDATPGLERIAPVPLNIVCFRYAAPGLDAGGTLWGGARHGPIRRPRAGCRTRPARYSVWSGTLVTTRPFRKRSRPFRIRALWLWRMCCHQWLTTNSGISTVMISLS